MNAPVTSREGYTRLQARLKAALDSYYAVCATNADAAAAGDNSVWHDNFAYEQNQRDMHKWATRVKELKQLLASVRVIAPPPAPSAVQVGCVVTLRDEDENKEWVFEVAGYEDGDVEQGRVSYTSPLMQKLLGCEAGEERELFLDGKERTITVAAVESAAGKEKKDG